MIGWFKNFKVMKATKCGHETKLKGKIKVFDKEIGMEMRANEKGKVEYCLDCIGKMSIRCAWCGESIVIGEPITLYSPNDNFEIPEYAVEYRDPAPNNCLRLVGCLRWDCADSGASRSGFWMPGENGQGKVERVMSPFEMIMYGKTGSDPVIISDTGNMQEAIETQNKVLAAPKSQ